MVRIIFDPQPSPPPERKIKKQKTTPSGGGITFIAPETTPPTPPPKDETKTVTLTQDPNTGIIRGAGLAIDPSYGDSGKVHALIEKKYTGPATSIGPSDPSYQYLIKHAEPEEARALRRVAEGQVPIGQRERLYPSVYEKAWESLDPQEKQEFGYKFTEWESIPIEERKYYYGASQHFETIPPSEREKLAREYVAEHPKKRFIVPSVQGGLLPNITYSATGFKAGIMVSYEEIQRFKKENIIEDIAIIALTKGGQRRPTYSQAEKHLIEGAKYEMFYTDVDKQRLRENYYASLPPHRRVGIAIGHATVSATLWPVTLTQSVVKFINNNKTVFLPDVARDMERTRLGPSGVIGPAISEVWLNQDVSYIKQQQKKYPIETAFATLGEIAGAYVGGRALGFGYGAFKSGVGRVGARIKFHAPYSVQQLPYKIRFKYAQVTGRGMYSPKKLGPVKYAQAKYIDLYKTEPISKGIGKPTGKFLYDPTTGHATKLATGKEFTRLDYKKITDRRRITGLRDGSGNIYDVGWESGKRPPLATGKAIWTHTNKDAILIAGWKKKAYDFIDDTTAQQAIAIQKPQIQNISIRPALKTIHGRFGLATRATGVGFSNILLAQSGIITTAVNKQSQDNMNIMKHDLEFQTQLQSGFKRKLAFDNKQDYIQLQYQDNIIGNRQDSLIGQAQAQMQAQTQKAKLQQDYFFTPPRMDYKFPKSKSPKTHLPKIIKTIPFGGEDERVKKFNKKTKKKIKREFGFEVRIFKGPRIKDLLPKEFRM